MSPSSSTPHAVALPPVALTDDCNYVAAFLTMACPYRCSYCINEFEGRRRVARPLNAEAWIAGLSRLANLDRDSGPIPVTLQGGEPSCHPGFYDIINGVPERIALDVLTNLSFDVGEMIARVDPRRLRRDAPYASIRVSYHPSEADIDELLAKTHRLLEAGFSVGVYGVLHPDTADHIHVVQERARAEGIDFRTKEFLGFAHGKLYGQYRYEDACSCNVTRPVHCRTTELIIGPNGNIYRCHHDIYENYPPIGHLLDADFRMEKVFRPCDCFGHCNPCDVKVKTNRLQQFGHTSVEIRFEQPEDRSTPQCSAAACP